MGALDELLARAEQRYRRLPPEEAHAAMVAGALLVDTRPLDQRVADGEVPGAVVVGRNVLEWRFDPVGAWRMPEADPERPVVLLCDQGCSTVLAVDRLLDLGYLHATDVVGGFRAWRAAGLPVMAAGSCLDRSRATLHADGR